MNEEPLKNKEKTFFGLIVLFPLLNLWFSIITNHSYLRVFYFLYVLVFFVNYIYVLNGRVKISFACIIVFIAIKLTYDYFAYPDSLSDAIELAILFMLFYVYSRTEIITRYRQYLYNYKNLVLVTYIVYLLGVCITIISGSGITNKWNTTSIQGAYGLPHYFAYEEFVLLANCYYMYLIEYKNRTKWIVLASIFSMLLILTTARTVILCLAISVAYVFLNAKGYKKIGLSLIGVTGLTALFRYTRLFNSVIEKTKYARNLGSATSSRYLIYKSSWACYKSGTITEKVLGKGIMELLRWNHANIRMQIQAHNDFLTVLVSFGVISCIIYVICLIKCCKQSGGIGLFLAIGSLIVFNGLYSYGPLIIGLPSIKLVFKMINENYTPIVSSKIHLKNIIENEKNVELEQEL